LDRQLKDELSLVLRIVSHPPTILFAAPQGLFPVIAFHIVIIIIKYAAYVNIFFVKF